MNRTEKELWLFNKFCTFKNLKCESIKQLEPPHPDIIFKTSTETIGVELTELNSVLLERYNPNHLEAQRKNICLKCQEEIKKYIPFGLAVSIIFREDVYLTKKEVESTINLVMTIFQDLKPKFYSEFTSWNDIDDYNLKFNVNISSVSFFKNHEISHVATEVGDVVSKYIPDLPIEIVNQNVLIKSNKYHDRTNLDEIWLLLHFGHSWATEFWKVNFTTIIKSKFDRIFLFNVKGENIFEF